MKLLESRKWLRISEAAQYLSLNFREEVQGTDILQLVLNQQLLLSVYLFEPVVALPVKLKFDAVNSMSDETPVEYDLLAESRNLRGLVDLLPVHGGIDAIESIYRQHLGGTSTPLRLFSGLLVRIESDAIYQVQESISRPKLTETEKPNDVSSEEGGLIDERVARLNSRRSRVLFSLSESDSDFDAEVVTQEIKASAAPKNWFRKIQSKFRPAAELPLESLVCISMSNLQKLVAEYQQGSREKSTNSLGDLERSSLLKLVLGMAISKYDYRPDASRNLATGANKGSINADMERLGLPLDPETIRKFINEAHSKFDVQLPRKEK